MGQMRRPIAWSLLLALAGTNAIAVICLFAVPLAPGCPMPASPSGAAGVGSAFDCCLTCVADASLLSTHGLYAPIAVGVIAPASASVVLPIPPAARIETGRAPVPETAPVFLLNRALLI